MTNEMFLTEEEKEKLSQRRSDYINNAIDKSDKTLQKIVKKRLLPVKEKKQKDYEYYFNELSKTEEKITAEIAKDEASPTKARLKKWGEIQAIRDKAHTLYNRCRSTAFECNRLIKGLNIISLIFAKRDRQTTKYYNAIFDNQKTSTKLICGSKMSFWKTIRSTSHFLGGNFANTLTIILCILLAINNFVFMKGQDYHFVENFFFFFACATAAMIVFLIVNAISELLGLDFDDMPGLAIRAYGIYLGFSIGAMLLSHLDSTNRYWDTTKAIIILLIPLLARLCLCLFNILDYIACHIIDKHRKIYKRYYDFLEESWNESKEHYNNLVKERIEDIKESYYLDLSSLSKVDEIYSSILEKYDAWARNHSVIPADKLLSCQPKLDDSRISSRIEISIRRSCPRCGYRYLNKSTKSVSGGEETRRECVSGGYYETVEHKYDITMNGEKVGTATKEDRYYVSPEYEDYTYFKSTDYKNYSCPCCGNEWSRRGRTTTTRVSTETWQKELLKAANDILESFKNAKSK